MGGYLAFLGTGDAATDRILDELEAAGRAHHHTCDWDEPISGGESASDRIQKAANAAGAEMAKLRTDLEDARKLHTHDLTICREHDERQKAQIAELQSQLTTSRELASELMRERDGLRDTMSALVYWNDKDGRIDDSWWEDARRQVKDES